jgi:dihydrofolate reductase
VTHVSIVVAVARNGVIGRDNALPWRLPTDRRHFRRLTLGKPVIMGRLTWESIGRPLDRRSNIVVTRDRRYAAPGCRVVHSFEEALEAARPAEEVLVVGGAEIYAEALGVADRIYLTRVEAEVEGDTYFPDLPPGEWREVESEALDADQRNAHAMRFITLERAGRSAGR